jgi:hypothetical protein
MIIAIDARSLNRRVGRTTIEERSAVTGTGVKSMARTLVKDMMIANPIITA